MTKNSTRIASLLGTWTGQTHLKTDIGSYELMAYFVIHLMPDPMRGYACSLDDCSEVENNACVLNKRGDGVCQDIADNVLDWSDVSAFMYFGAKIDVGFPFNKHRAEDTGGWVGPMNIVMAQDEITLQAKDDSHIVDRYVSRYVQTPSTSFLQMPKNCTLLSEEDFRKVAGVDAVKYTTEGQFDPNGNDADPYDKYLDTCANGDVKPLLPLFQFDFVEDEDTKEETIEVKLNYKLMAIPSKKDYMYDIFPKIMGKVNRADLGFHISGPYCYGDDPKRGYSFDMNFDSRNPKKMIKLEHACIEGLPCTPPAADLYVHSGSSSIDVKPLPDDATTVDVSSSIFFAIAIAILSGVILFLFRSNHSLRKRLEEDTSAAENEDNVEQEERRISTPFVAMEDSNPIAESDNVNSHGVEENADEETQNLLEQESE
jgi:hypothetical protein